MRRTNNRWSVVASFIEYPSRGSMWLAHQNFDTFVYSSSFLWVQFADSILCVINKVD